MKKKLNIKKFGIIIGVLIVSLVAPVLVFLTCYEFFLWNSAGFNKDYRKIIKCLDKTKGVWDYQTRTCLSEPSTPKGHATEIKVIKNILDEKTLASTNPNADNSKALEVKPDPNNLEQIFTNDDLCALLSYQKRTIENQNEKLPDSMAYFVEHSEAKNSFEDLKMALAGKPARTPIGQYYSNLVLAGLGWGSYITYKGPAQYDRAIHGFESLMEQEPGNGAPIIFEIATLSLANKPIPPVLIAELENADHFDSHLLSFNKELANSNLTSATNYLMDIAYLAAIPMPDWIKIQQQLKVVFKSRPDLIIKIADLLTVEGRNAKVGSDSAGFALLEYSVGRGLYPKDQRPLNYVELNKKLGQHFGDELSLFEGLDTKCNPKLVEEVRAHAHKLRVEDRGLGMSL